MSGKKKRQGDKETRGGFLFVEFAEGQPVEVLRVGEFVDKNGLEVKITEDDLEAFVANFAAGAAGQEVPVDVRHERAEAGGWIKRLWKEGDKLLASVDWNELGQKLVKERIYRYLSATIDLAKKVIKSISLVNFPAVKGLRPVELSEGVYTFRAEKWMEGIIKSVTRRILAELGEGGDEEEDDAELTIRKEDDEIVLYSEDGSKVLGRFPFGPGAKYPDEDAARAAAEEREKEIERIKHTKEAGEMTDEEKAALREKIREELLAEMAEEKKTEAEMREEIRADVVVEFKEQFEAELAEKYERRAKLIEFAEELCDGDDSGLSAKPEDVVAALEALPEDQVESVQALLKSKMVDFTERGSSGKGKGDKKKLPAEIAVHLHEWMAAKFELAEFFEDNEMGDPDEYDLSEFEKKED